VNVKFQDLFHYSVFQQNWRLRPAPITSAVSWKEVKVGGRKGNEVRKHGTYSGAKRSIVEHWFPLNADCFVKCMFMQRIKYSWIMHINSRAWLYKSTPFFSIGKEQKRTSNNAVRLPMFLSRGFWTDWAPAAISRLPLRWLVTQKEHKSTQTPILLKNTIVRRHILDLD
jgi:hypothetical protein